MSKEQPITISTEEILKHSKVKTYEDKVKKLKNIKQNKDE